MAYPKNHSAEFGLEKSEKEKIINTSKQLGISQRKFCRYAVLTIVAMINNPQLEVSLNFKDPRFNFEEVKNGN